MGKQIWYLRHVAGCALLVAALPLGAQPLLTEGRFGPTFVALDGSLQAGPREGHRLLPLPVEGWARLESKRGYNILIANEPKASGTHWELYTHVGSGFPAVYFPGNTPAEVSCQVDITDGQWPCLALAADGQRARLYLHGQLRVEPPADSRTFPDASPCAHHARDPLAEAFSASPGGHPHRGFRCHRSPTWLPCGGSWRGGVVGPRLDVELAGPQGLERRMCR